MLALFLEEEETTISMEVLDALLEMVVVTMKDEPWVIYFDGSSTTTRGEAAVVLINLEG